MYFAKIDLVDRLLKLLGFQNSCDTTTVVTQAHLEQIKNEIFQMDDDISIIFTDRPSRRKNNSIKETIAIINKLFKKWGFTQIYTIKQRKMIKGKRKTLSSIYKLKINPKYKNIKFLDQMWINLTEKRYN